MRILFIFFILVFAACSHAPKVSDNYKKMRQKREIATTGIVGWAQDKFVETSASNEDAVSVKLENLKRELSYVEKYSVMFTSTSDTEAFQEAFFVLSSFLNKYEEAWRFATDESKELHEDKFIRVLDKATEQIEKAAFHMKINDIEYEYHLLRELHKSFSKLKMAYDRLEQEPTFESKYANMTQASKLAEAEMKNRRGWFFWQRP